MLGSCYTTSSLKLYRDKASGSGSWPLIESECKCNNCFPEEDKAKVLEKEKNAHKRLVLEMLHILSVSNCITTMSLNSNRLSRELFCALCP